MARRLLTRRIGRRWCERSSSDVFDRRDHYASTACASKNLKVAIVGAAGEAGRILALCLKQSGIIDELAIYDTHPTRGLLLQLSHMDSRCRTIVEDEVDCCAADASYLCHNKLNLERALAGANIVAITLDRNETLCEEAERLEKIISSLVGCCPKVTFIMLCIYKDTAWEVSGLKSRQSRWARRKFPGRSLESAGLLLEYTYQAFVALVSQKVNSLVPMLYELYKKAGLFEASSRIFGVLNLFTTRANSFAAETLKIEPEFVSVPVIGGGCTKTCVPLFSQTKPCADLTFEEMSKLMLAMKSTGEAAKSSSLCLGFAAARFCTSLSKALRAESGVTECAYVRSCLVPELKYFGSALELGPSGLQKQLGIPRIRKFECEELYLSIPKIQRDIQLGEGLALGLKESSEMCPIPARCCTTPCQVEV